MQDIHTNIAPVINLSEKTIEQSIDLSREYTPIKIHIDILDTPEIVTIPVRIIDGMERVIERRTVNNRQFRLIESLVALMQESPLLRA